MTRPRRRRVKQEERIAQRPPRIAPAAAPSRTLASRAAPTPTVGGDLPAHSTARSLRQARVARLGRQAGNAAVQRSLALQRQVKPEKTKGQAAVGSKKAKLQADLSLSSDGKLKLNAGPALNLKLFGMSAMASVDPKGWKGVGKLRLGNKANYVAPQVTVGSDGKLSFEFEQKFTRDMLTLSNKLAAGAKETTMSHSVGLKNVFGVGGFDVSAAIKYRLNDPRLTGVSVEGGYTLYKGGRGAPKLMLILRGSYQAGSANKRDEAKGFVLLRLGG